MHMRAVHPCYTVSYLLCFHSPVLRGSMGGGSNAATAHVRCMPLQENTCSLPTLTHAPLSRRTLRPPLQILAHGLAPLLPVLLLLLLCALLPGFGAQLQQLMPRLLSPHAMAAAPAAVCLVWAVGCEVVRWCGRTAGAAADVEAGDDSSAPYGRLAPVMPGPYSAQPAQLVHHVRPPVGRRLRREGSGFVSAEGGTADGSSQQGVVPGGAGCVEACSRRPGGGGGVAGCGGGVQEGGGCVSSFGSGGVSGEGCGGCCGSSRGDDGVQSEQPSHVLSRSLQYDAVTRLSFLSVKVGNHKAAKQRKVVNVKQNERT